MKRSMSPLAKYCLSYGVFFLLLCVASMQFDCQLNADFLRAATQKGLLAGIWNKRFALFLYIAMITGTTHLLLLKNVFMRIAAHCILFLSMACSVAIYVIEDRRTLSVDMAVVLDGAFNMAAMPMETVSFFWKQLATTLLVTILLTAVIAFVAGRIRKIPVRHSAAPIVLTLFFGLSALLLVPSFRGHIDGVPIYSRNILYAVSEGLKEEALYRGARAQPDMLPKNGDKSIRHILYIMDESVGGKYLSLNGYSLPTTPFLSSHAGEFHNYGQAAASGNLSKSSNILCISGLRADQLPDSDQAALKQASIFDYANQAGRKSYYVDAQRMARANYLMSRDMRILNYIKVFGKAGSFELDMLAADLIEKIVKSEDSPTFIYLLKWGCHFDYQGRYNPDMDYAGLESDGDIPESYLRAVRWSVDEFFKKLAAGLANEDVMIVYTSDHGQSFGPATSSPHGTHINPPSDQANVPLLLWPISNNARDVFSQCGGYNPEQFDRASHFQIFPTILELMGYDKEETTRRFGLDLFGSPPQKRIFASGDIFYTPSSNSVFRINEFTSPASPRTISD